MSCSIVANPRLAAVLRECADYVEQGQFNSKCIYQALEGLHEYSQTHAKAVREDLAARKAASATTATSVVEEDWWATGVSLSATTTSSSASSVNDDDSFSTTRKTVPSRPAFQRPTNPNSIILANGWIQLEQQKRKLSFTGVNQKTYWKDVLVSLVQRPNDIPTLWIQREVLPNAPTAAGSFARLATSTLKTELEVLHRIPLSEIVNVEYVNANTDHRLAIQIASSELLVLKSDDKEAAQNWVLTLRSIQETGPQLQPQKSSGTDKTDKRKKKQETEKKKNKQHDDTDKNEDTEKEKEKKEPAGAMRTEESSSVSPEKAKERSNRNEQEPETKNEENKLPPGDSVSTSPPPTSASGEPAKKRMAIKELKAIAHGAGIPTKGMTRNELEETVAKVQQGKEHQEASQTGSRDAEKEEEEEEEQRRQQELENVRKEEERRRAEEEQERLRREQQEAEEEEKRRQLQEVHRQHIAARIAEQRQKEVEQRQKEREEKRRKAQEEEQRRAAEEQQRRQADEWMKQQEEEAQRRLAEMEAAEQKRQQVETARRESELKQRQEAARWEAEHRQKQQEEAARQKWQQQQAQWRQFQQEQDAQKQTWQQQQAQQQQEQWEKFFQHSAQQPPPQSFQAGTRPPPPSPPPPSKPTAAQAPPPPRQPTGSTKYARMAETISPAVSQERITDIKRNVLLYWALQPPQNQSLRQITDLICSVQRVLPPAFGVPSHIYFSKWKPIAGAELVPIGSAVDKDLLKKSVRKLRFFLHPDRLPKNLSEEQSYVVKMVWDICNDAWEEYQKHADELDWVAL